MTINPARTHYAPNIAKCAEIEEKPKKSGKKEKQQLTCAWDTPPLMVERQDSHQHVCDPFAWKIGKKEHLCSDSAATKNTINLAGTYSAPNIAACAK